MVGHCRFSAAGADREFRTPPRFNPHHCISSRVTMFRRAVINGTQQEKFGHEEGLPVYAERLPSMTNISQESLIHDGLPAGNGRGQCASLVAAVSPDESPSDRPLPRNRPWAEFFQAYTETGVTGQFVGGCVGSRRCGFIAPPPHTSRPGSDSVQHTRGPDGIPRRGGTLFGKDFRGSKKHLQLTE